MTSDPVQPAPPAPNTRILVVDDEPSIRQPLHRALTLAGYRAAEAASGEEALSCLAEIPYDLMILDLNMPGIQGAEVMAQAHRLYPQLLIIVLTGHATLESAIEAVKSDAEDYLQKPASTQDILAAVERILLKQQEAQEQQALLRTIGEAVDGLHHKQREPSNAEPEEEEEGHG